MKLLSAECESESECDGNFFVALFLGPGLKK